MDDHKRTATEENIWKGNNKPLIVKLALAKYFDLLLIKEENESSKTYRQAKQTPAFALDPAELVLIKKTILSHFHEWHIEVAAKDIGEWLDVLEYSLPREVCVLLTLGKKLNRCRFCLCRY